jgi:hypothetical protein
MAEEAAQRREVEEKRIKEKSEAAEKAAQVAAGEALAHNTPVKHLSVKAVSHYGHSSRYPGYTDLDVTTALYAHVVIKLTRYGHSTEHLEWGAKATAIARVIQWTCKRPGGVYRYAVTARSDVGPSLTKRGRFAPVSFSRCHALERQEAEARERSERKYMEEVGQEEREARERRERYEYNCRAEGGTPVTLYTNEGAERYCRAPGGGLLPVPH